MRIQWDDDEGIIHRLEGSCEPPKNKVATCTRSLPNVDSDDVATDGAPDDERHKASHEQVTADVQEQRLEYDPEQVLYSVASSEPSARTTLEDMSELDAQQTPRACKSSQHGYMRVNAAMPASQPERLPSRQYSRGRRASAAEARPAATSCGCKWCAHLLLICCKSLLMMSCAVALGVWIWDALEDQDDDLGSPHGQPASAATQPFQYLASMATAAQILSPPPSPSLTLASERPRIPPMPPPMPPLPSLPLPSFSPPSFSPPRPVPIFSPPSPSVPPPMPTSPPPPRPLPLSTVDLINARFMQGSPSNDIAAAGVLVASFDLETSYNPDALWQPGPSLDDKCKSSNARVSASLIRKGFSNVWSVGQGGFVVNPTRAVVKCAYARDGHSCATPTGCDPWCSSGQRKFFGCAYPAPQLYDALSEQVQRYASVAALPPEEEAFGQYQLLGHLQDRYNEVVLDATAWTEALPYIIEAVVLHAHASFAQQAATRAVHAQLLSSFPVLQGRWVVVKGRWQRDTRTSLPLLVYDAAASPPFLRE